MRLAGAAASRRALLQWYEPRRSVYPWRRTADAYRVLLSEVMLQQTQAARVARAFDRFVRSFPTLHALADAPVSDVIRAWDGLGYNRRAVSLHRAARVIEAEHAGRVPDEVRTLRSLPGVGPYTAAAVASISFGVPVAAVDTNVARVVSRMWGASGTAEVRACAAAWLDRRDPGAWNQAVMDLGRIACRARPSCAACPLRSTCPTLGGEPARGRRTRADPFDGSARQLRGALVRMLRDRRSATLGALAREAGRDIADVASAVGGLHADGLVVAGPGARRGRSAGRVRLP